MNFILITLAIKYPMISSFIGVVGVLRLIFKPISSFVHAVVLATPNYRDNEILTRVETSCVYKITVWLVDYISSIKIDPKIK